MTKRRNGPLGIQFGTLAGFNALDPVPVDGEVCFLTDSISGSTISAVVSISGTVYSIGSGFTGEGTPNQIPKFATAGSLTDSNLSDDGSFVLIATLVAEAVQIGDSDVVGGVVSGGTMSVVSTGHAAIPATLGATTSVYLDDMTGVSDGGIVNLSQATQSVNAFGTPNGTHSIQSTTLPSGGPFMEAGATLTCLLYAPTYDSDNNPILDGMGHPVMAYQTFAVITTSRYTASGTVTITFTDPPFLPTWAAPTGTKLNDWFGAATPFTLTSDPYNDNLTVINTFADHFTASLPRLYNEGSVSTAGPTDAGNAPAISVEGSLHGEMHALVRRGDDGHH